MPAAKRIQFTEEIAAPVERVFESMTALETYKKWTAAFMEGSYYEGSWDQGQKILFLSPSGHGMVAEIAENRPNHFISIRHIGTIANGVEDTDSEAVRAWTPAYENYTFLKSPVGTTVIVDMDVLVEYEAFMAETWPKALRQLKAICEQEAT